MRKAIFIPLLGLLVLGCVAANELQFLDLMPGVWNLTFKSGSLNDSFRGRMIKNLWYPSGQMSIVFEKKGTNIVQMLTADGRVDVEEVSGGYPEYTIKLKAEVGSNRGIPIFETGSLIVTFVDHDHVSFKMNGPNDEHRDIYFGALINRTFIRAEAISETEAKNLTEKNKEGL